MTLYQLFIQRLATTLKEAIPTLDISPGSDDITNIVEPIVNKLGITETTLLYASLTHDSFINPSSNWYSNIASLNNDLTTIIMFNNKYRIKQKTPMKLIISVIFGLLTHTDPYPAWIR